VQLANGLCLCCADGMLALGPCVIGVMEPLCTSVTLPEPLAANSILKRAVGSLHLARSSAKQQLDLQMMRFGLLFTLCIPGVFSRIHSSTQKADCVWLIV